MPTPAQEAQSEGLEALRDACGETWTLGSQSFVGVGVALQPTDARLPGSSARLLDLEVSPADLPSPPPTRGDEIVRDSIFYTVVKNGYFNAATQRWVFELTAP